MKEINKPESGIEKILDNLQDDDILVAEILSNVIRCNHCQSIIESLPGYDYKKCDCKRVAVDGGHSYLRRCYQNDLSDFEDLSELLCYDKSKTGVTMMAKDLIGKKNVIWFVYGKTTSR